LCVFDIDIIFKGSQSLSNMRFKVTAVSYLHSGVIDTAEHVTAVSDFLVETVCQIIPGVIPKKSCLHSGVNVNGEVV
jgi:hypothetical protein